MSSKPIVLLQPAPQKRDRIFSPETLKKLHTDFEVIDLEASPDEQLFEKYLPQAIAIIGQPDLDESRIERATMLRAIVNVEGNFFPNVDYPAAFRKGVRVLGCGPAYSEAVAEYALGLALDLARGISREDRAFRRGEEKYVSESTGDSVLLRHASVGFVGFGNIGRSLHRLLEPFRPDFRAYDPWLPTSVLEDMNIIPSTLEETLAMSQFVFILAAVTSENQHLIDADKLRLLSDGAKLILVSRAAVIDFDALLVELESGRIAAGIDVWPEEPWHSDNGFRRQENAILSAHRAGGIRQAFFTIGEMVVDDLALVAVGLPPIRMQVAAPELVGRYRSKPVS